MRCIDFIIGSCAYYISKTPAVKNIFEKGLISFSILILTISMLYTSVIIDSEFFLSAAWVFLGFSIVISLATTKNGLLSNKIMVFLGEISFELFMVHQLVIRYTVGILKKMGIVANLIVYIIAVVISIVFAISLNRLHYVIQKRNEKT